jgi:hypothetical protein
VRLLLLLRCLVADGGGCRRRMTLHCEVAQESDTAPKAHRKVKKIPAAGARHRVLLGGPRQGKGVDGGSGQCRWRLVDNDIDVVVRPDTTEVYQFTTLLHKIQDQPIISTAVEITYS